MSGAYTPGDVPETPADLRALAAALRRSNAVEADEIAANLETLADSRDPAMKRRLTVQRISHLTGDFRKLVVGHLRVAQRLEAMGAPSLAAHYRARADEYDATADALAGTIAE